MKTETRIKRAIDSMEAEVLSTLRLIVVIMLQNTYSDDWQPMMEPFFDLEARLATCNNEKLNSYASYMNVLANQWIQHEPIYSWMVGIEMEKFADEYIIVVTKDD